MHFTLIIPLVVAVLIGAGIVQHSYTADNETHEQSLQQPTPTAWLTPTETPQQEISPTIQTSPTITPKPTTNQIPSNTISLFIYPGGSIKSQAGNSLHLASSDNPKTITDWYKNKLEALDYSVTSFVTTTTNGNTKNVLAAANASVEYRIEISKHEGESDTTIQVVLSSLDNN